MKTYKMEIKTTYSVEEPGNAQEIQEYIESIAQDYKNAEYDSCDVKLEIDGAIYMAGFGKVVGPASDCQ